MSVTDMTYNVFGGMLNLTLAMFTAKSGEQAASAY